jgi:hypothetical protein
VLCLVILTMSGKKCHLRSSSLCTLACSVSPQHCDFSFAGCCYNPNILFFKTWIRPPRHVRRLRIRWIISLPVFTSLFPH